VVGPDRATVRLAWSVDGPPSEEGWKMPRYLISFDDGAMTFPESELPDVSRDAHEVVRQAKAAGVWVFGGGLHSQDVSVVGTDSVITVDPADRKVRVGGFCIVDVPSKKAALEWAAKTAVACRCAQDVREFMFDPDE
jgi:hypothetical protein